MQDQFSEYSACLEGISGAGDVATLRHAVMEALALKGISGAYFLAPLTSDPRIGRMLSVSGISPVWERHYRARLHEIDPLPALSVAHSSGYIWPEQVKKARLSKRQRRYLDLAARYGMGRGIGVAAFGPMGRSGFLGCLWPFEEEPDDETRYWVFSVAQASFQRYCQIVGFDEDYPALSRREHEVLGWICDGKSNPVIAEILGISRSSIDVYVRRIFAKLGVADRTAACVRAVSLGLIASSDYRKVLAEAQRQEPGIAID